MNTLDEIEQAKTMSMLDWRPVVFGDFCFWFGLIMPKKYAFLLVCAKLIATPVTPTMKREAFEDYYFMVGELRKSGYVLGFDISEYNESSTWNYLTSKTYHLSKEDELLGSWKNNPQEIIEFFFPLESIT